LSFSQSNEDSLRLKLENSKNDSSKINLLLEAGERQLKTHPDTAYVYFKHALDLSKQLNNKRLEAKSSMLIGNYLNKKELFKESVEHYLNAIEINKLINNQQGLADCYSNIGSSFAYLNSIDKGLEYYFKALAIYVRINDISGEAIIYNILGDLHYVQKNYEKAEDYYTKAIRIFLILNDKLNILYSYINLGNVISDKGDIEDGMKYYFKSIKLGNELRDYEGIAISYTNIGDCYLIQGDYEKALEYFYKSLNLSKKFDYKALDPLNYLNISQTFLDSKDFKNTILYANKSLESSKKVSWSYKEYDSYSFLSLAYEKLGDYKKAYENQKIFLKYSDSIYNVKKIEKLTKADMLFELENQEKKISILLNNKDLTKVKLKNQKRLSMLLVIFGLVFTIIAFLLNKIRKEKNKALKLLFIQKIRAEESDRLKSAFLANMSHEIRTPMNAIMGFSGFLKNPDLSKEKMNRFVDIILKSGERLMTIINDIIDISKIESNQLKVDINEVNIIHAIKDIIEIQKKSNQLLISKNLNLNLNILGDSEKIIIKTDENRFTQVVTNLINNAVKFTEKGFIEIGFAPKIISDKKYLEFYVQDSGCGIPLDKFKIVFDRFSQAGEDDFKEGNGLGLSISKGIITLLGGKIWVESEVGVGTTFYFTLPY